MTTRQWGEPLIKTIIDDPKWIEKSKIYDEVFNQPRSFKSHSQLLIFEQDGKEVKRACIVVGSLAIHDDLIEPEYFQISHVPTRADFMSAVPTTDDQAYNHEQLINWCKAVQSRYLEHWEKLNRLTPQNYRSELSNIFTELNELREWCLSCPL